ncbi:hypothetical protein ACFU5P_27825 [Streptomyces sp. NPDC057433]|uniref:hypothetical protein n=1 Tax=Streptomyces sp. NPDC057433 TaxID=3346132 RepID=UPI0036925372
MELLNSTVHRINARAEKKATEAFVAEFTKVRGKSGLLGKTVASLGALEGSVREVIYPAAGGEKTLKDLVAETKATNAAFARSKREVFKSSYSNHCRSGLMKLLGVLDFRSSNDQHRPVMDALKLIERHKAPPPPTCRSARPSRWREVVRKDRMEFAIFTPDKGPKRVMRTVYEACVFQALRDRLRCKEIWVVGADKWRNPDEDLPYDFEVRRAEYYEKLNKPRDAKVFIAQLRSEMRAELGALDTKLPKLPWVTIVNTLMLQDVLGEPEWADLLTPADRRGRTLLFWSHVRPYGEVNLDLDTRLNLTAATVPGPRAADGKGVRSTVEKA